MVPPRVHRTRVSVSETPDAVLLHIRVPGDVEPGSVEVRFAERNTVVVARDAMGRPIRSHPSASLSQWLRRGRAPTTTATACS